MRISDDGDILMGLFPPFVVIAPGGCRPARALFRG